MARPTNAALTAENTVLRRAITVALELHIPVPSLQPGQTRVMCRLCREPYPCDTAVALGAR